MGIKARLLTVQDISRLAGRTETVAHLEQPVTPVATHWKPLHKMRSISIPEEVANVCYTALCTVDEFCTNAEATFRFCGFAPDEVFDRRTGRFLGLLYYSSVERPLNNACSAFLGSRFAIQSILTRQLLSGFIRRWNDNLRWNRLRPYTPQQYIEVCHRMREEAYELLTRICEEHGVRTPVALEKKEPFRCFPSYRAVSGAFF